MKVRELYYQSISCNVVRALMRPMQAHEMLDLTYDNLKGFILVCFLIQKPRVLLLSTKYMHYSTVNLTIE